MPEEYVPAEESDDRFFHEELEEFRKLIIKNVKQQPDNKLYAELLRDKSKFLQCFYNNFACKFPGGYTARMVDERIRKLKKAGEEKKLEDWVSDAGFKRCRELESDLKDEIDKEGFLEEAKEIEPVRSDYTDRQWQILQKLYIAMRRRGYSQEELSR